jgi:hypothetical protein
MNGERTQDFNKPGQWLAHYTKSATAFEHILPTKQLRMSPYHRMRDPTENKDLILSGRGWREQPDARAAWVGALRGVKRIRDGMRLLSLTHDDAAPNDVEPTFACCWARPRTWEQYADEHRGVCLVFRRETLIGTLRSELNAQGVYYLGEVRYTPGGIAASPALRLDEEQIFLPRRHRSSIAGSCRAYREAP